jgi:hypothetical protein
LPTLGFDRPHELAGPLIERDEPRVDLRHEDLAAAHREAAARPAERIAARGIGLPPVAPKNLARVDV